MNAPHFFGATSASPGVTCLAAATPVPGFGALPVNAYLIEAAEPVLVDTGLPLLASETMDALASRIDPADLRWIWLTHCDPDHLGALDALLAAAPRARVVTNYLGMGKLSLRAPLPPERFYLINPGQRLDVGDRSLVALSMPSYDAPETMGLFDPRSRSLFTSDCFGALLGEEDIASAAEHAGAIAPQRLGEGLVTWTTVDAPWLAQVDAARFRATLASLGEVDADTVLSAHLPPAHRMFSTLAAHVDAARTAGPFVGPDQAALEAMLAAVVG